MGSEMSRGIELYLDLMKRSLTYSLWAEAHRPYQVDRYGSAWSRPLRRAVNSQLRRRDLMLMQPIPYNKALRETGRDWPAAAHTMIGLRRLDNIQQCIEDALRNNIPGDVIETGVWRGGATIFMRAALKAHGVTDRLVWVADSFEGLPPPDPEKYPADAKSQYHTLSSDLAISIETVKANFERYGLLDDQVRFLKGWFKDTLPTAPFAKFAVIRLDGDMYESTMDALVTLYPKLARGGYAILDDYGLADGLCKRAATDYRREHGIADEIIDIDGQGAYWRRS
jgi:Macrocin-O-methyltransferase (TylF)